MTGIEGDLAAEISATNADFVSSVNTRLGAEEAARASVDALLSAEIVVEQGRIDAILAGSDVNLDQFAEVVSYIDSLDLEDDNFLANQIASMNLRDAT